MDLTPFADIGLDDTLLAHLIDEHVESALPRLDRWWSYFRNQDLGRGAAQEAGLPARVTGRASSAVDDRASLRREVVIENDIAWRVQTMVDFMFGRPVPITSTAGERAPLIEHVLDRVWQASGGIALLQDMALLGHVHGHVDLMLRTDDLIPGSPGDEATLLDRAQGCRIEIIDPRRGIPILNPSDYRELDAFIVHFSMLQRGVTPDGERQTTNVTEIASDSHRQRYEDGSLVLDEPLRPSIGRVPVVHIQNLGQPFRYPGLGEVEPLVPLQDELNTRLSDRASRVTMQSFKMYLAKGIEGFDTVAVGPGQVWSTNNSEAEVIAFGGDASSPSEESHIEQVREAMDKVSAVPPLASGVVRARIGNLSSATALRVTLMGLLAKTMRKRVTYGRGITEMSRMVLDALDASGVFPTSPEERHVQLEWADPIGDLQPQSGGSVPVITT